MVIMTGDKYTYIDVPFCVRCSRFMVIKVGRIWVALNHETDKELTIRVGEAYRCPECACIVIHHWRELDFLSEKTRHQFEDLEYWKIFLEDHTHYNMYHPYK